MRYKYSHKIDRLKVMTTAVTQNHGNCWKSRQSWRSWIRDLHTSLVVS